MFKLSKRGEIKMTILLRVEMIFLAMAFLFIVVRNVNKKRLLLRYSLIWISVAVILMIIALLPTEAIYRITGFFGIETPSNFIFLLVNIGLIGMCFFLTSIVSKQTEQIKTLVQDISILRHEQTEKN